MSMSRGLYGCVFLFSLVHCSGVRAQVAPSSSWSLPNCMTNTLGAAIVGAADLIDDGAIEVLGVDLIANTLEILHVDSSGWTSIASHSVASGPVAAVAGDIDGDGDIDLAVSCRGVDPATNQIVPVVTLLRATVGGFARTDLPCPWLLTDGRLALEDLDGDGDQDLVFGSQAVVMNLGSAGFATQATFPLGALAPGARVLFADLDGDGDQDFLRWVPAPSGPAIIEWLSQGPTGVVATATFSLVHPLDDLALGDFDGDGNTDFVTAWSEPGPFGQSETVYLRAYLNEANGSWVVGARHAVATLNTVPLPLPVVTPLRIKAYRASLDGDAIDDVQVRVFDPRNATASLFGSLGTANGVFLDAGMAGLDVSNAELVWHDLDFDGDDDLVLTNPLQSCVRLMNSSPMPQPSEWLSVEHLIRAKGFMGQGWTIPPRLRLRDLATGCPVAGRTLSVAYRRPDGVGTTMSLTTDASGELALPPTFGVAEGELIALVSGTTFAPRVVEASVYRFSLFKNLAPPSGGPFVSTRFRKGPGQPAVLSLVADLPQLPLPTPFGTIHTSVLAPGPGLLAIDGLGLLGSPDPAGVAAPEFFRVFSIPSGLPPGLALTVQAYSMDLDFGWPDALVITPPHQIVF